MTIDINTSDLTYIGMPIRVSHDGERIEVYCNGYIEARFSGAPDHLKDMVVEGFAEAGETMDDEDKDDLWVWDEVERRIWDAMKAEAAEQRRRDRDYFGTGMI
jgi:hypothetical protein